MFSIMNKIHQILALVSCIRVGVGVCDSNQDENHD